MKHESLVFSTFDILRKLFNRGTDDIKALIVSGCLVMLQDTLYGEEREIIESLISNRG